MSCSSWAMVRHEALVFRMEVEEDRPFLPVVAVG